LKRSGLSIEDLIYFYQTVIRPTMEYCCPVWHPGLTEGQTEKLEKQQERALRIIMPEASYDLALQIACLDTLVQRRESICKTFFNKICSDPDHKLNYLLPPTKASSNTRRPNKFPLPKLKNDRYKSSFIVHSVFKSLDD